MMLSHHSASKMFLGAIVFCFMILASGQAVQPPISTAQPILTLKGHVDTISAVAASSDGMVLATASFDKSIRLWNAQSGKELRVLAGPQGHQGQVLSLALSASGDQLASGGADNFVKIWGVPSAFPTRPFATATAAMGAMTAYSAIGEFLPAPARLIRRNYLTPDLPLKTLQLPSAVNAIAFDPTGSLLAMGCHDGVVRIFDVVKAAQTKQIDAHNRGMAPQIPHPIYSISWSADGKQLLTASYDRSMKLWDAAAGSLIKEFKPAPGRATTDKPATAPGLVGHRDQIFAAVFSTDGKLIASGSSDQTLKLWDVGTGAVVRDFANPGLKPTYADEPAPSHPGWVQSVRFTRDGKKLITAGPAGPFRGYVGVWSVADGKLIAAVETATGHIRSLAISADERTLILGCGQGERGRMDSDAIVIPMPGM